MCKIYTYVSDMKYDHFIHPHIPLVLILKKKLYSLTQLRSGSSVYSVITTTASVALRADQLFYSDEVAIHFCLSVRRCKAFMGRYKEQRPSAVHIVQLYSRNNKYVCLPGPAPFMVVGTIACLNPALRRGHQFHGSALPRVASFNGFDN